MKQTNFNHPTYFLNYTYNFYETYFWQVKNVFDSKIEVGYICYGKRI